MNRTYPLTMPEGTAFPIKLALSRSQWWGTALTSVATFAMGVLGALYATGVLEPVRPAGRVLGALFAVGMVALSLRGLESHLTLHDDRIEEASMLGLRRVIPIAWVRGFRIRGAGPVMLYDHNDHRVAEIGLVYERPELFFEYLSQRLVDCDEEDAAAWRAEYERLRGVATHSGQSPPDAEAAHRLGWWLLCIEILSIPICLAIDPRWAPSVGAIAVYSLLCVAISLRVRFRRLSQLRGVLEPLRAAQFVLVLGLLAVASPRLPELAALPRAGLIIVLAALPLVWLERVVDGSRGRVASFASSFFLVMALVFDLNARLGSSSAPFRAEISSTCCACNRPRAVWHAIELGRQGSFNLNSDTCARYANGGHVMFLMHRGAFGLSFIERAP